jgi:polar amino acid transport system substrate-binding protein
MKRQSWVVAGLVLVVGLALAACGPAQQPASGQPTGSILDLGGREIIVAVENAYPPFNMLDDEGNGIGYDYDLFTEICERANCTPVFEEFAWEGMFEAAQAGEFDISCDGITIKLDRAKIIDYSDPIIEYGMVLLVRADETDFTNAETLAALPDKLAGVQLGTTNEDTIRTYLPDERIKSFDDFPTAVTAMIAGDVDAIPIDMVAAVGYMRENPDELKILDEPLTSGELIGIILPPGSEILPAVNAALNAMWDDGTMDELYQRWFVLD